MGLIHHPQSLFSYPDTIWTGPSDILFPVMLADPPWRYMTYSSAGLGRSADAHYDTMTLDQIRGLPVVDLAAKDCVLLMWVTDPFLEHAFSFIQYKTVGFYWMKLNKRADAANMTERSFFTGQGHWTRANPEQCLLATRGRPSRRKTATNVSRLIIDRRRNHSQKPDKQYGRIEQLLEGPYLELFARTSRPGWSSWGNQVDYDFAQHVRRLPSAGGRRLIAANDSGKAIASGLDDGQGSLLCFEGDLADVV